MHLTELLKNVKVQLIRGEEKKELADFQFDSRKIQTGDLFVAVKGTQVDGHTFIDTAIGQGAIGVVCENMPQHLQEEVTYIQVPDANQALAVISANFYGNAVEKMVFIGITGTNGKTTVATLLHTLMLKMGHHAGLVSTIRYLVGNEEFPSTHTTPDPKQLHQLFAEMHTAGCEYVFMEVSSHALAQQRTFGIPFRAGVFTNISHDHLDFHGTFAEYIKAKKKLFDTLDKDAFALINVDDRNGRIMVQNCKANIKTFAVKRMADYKARILENTFEGLQLEINRLETWFQIVGSFNAYNLLTVLGVMVELGFEQEEVLQYLSGLEGVEGRFQTLHSPKNQVTAVVDYAHTPDALKNVLETIKDINQSAGNIITVVGCGGDRDQTKRPKMAHIAAQLSDQVILTSDNPRTENPNMILQQMQNGVPIERKRKVLTIENRREAIRTAVQLASPRDILLVAGKGHETYQEINGVKHPFDDREVLKEAFNDIGI